MAVIKSRQSDPLMHDAVVLDLGDLNRQAAEIIERAEAEASVIVADAREEAARLVGEASGRGHEEGLTRISRASHRSVAVSSKGKKPSPSHPLHEGPARRRIRSGRHCPESRVRPVTCPLRDEHGIQLSRWVRRNGALDFHLSPMPLDRAGACLA